MSHTIEKVKLSQWDALLLEALRSLGWNEQQLLNIGAVQSLPIDESVYEWDYSELAAFAAAEPDIYRSAVQHGYRIKYNTIRGIRSWLHITYNIEAELILDEGEEAVVATLTEAQQDKLAQVLSPGWHIRFVSSSLCRIEPLYVATP
ncbi:hypothetical protein [Paenibacillus sp. WLX2291]|uniref:hypothetical protein n=1 Tax=Paenibacillus sp. WLX2291 TaxID=3296934 RepID=UPI00398451FF